MVRNRFFVGLLSALPVASILWVMIAACYLALTGCQTVRGYATCDNARIAVETAQRAVDRFCPMEAR
ncbi:hypothetical protein [Sphingobium sp. CAP-1]|uniref:hypothetical protein n=1 Tax=Sphingobium sp. CAP-1 TaxID=2676077 RepID=UPI0012BB35B5|nr:hypothetical protein [Sphingobium sp. CAP-1]QGP79989.1 hypothetical protein GL174_14105 [Sphingobium sp. CAP-1]